MGRFLQAGADPGLLTSGGWASDRVALSPAGPAMARTCGIGDPVEYLFWTGLRQLLVACQPSHTTMNQEPTIYTCHVYFGIKGEFDTEQLTQFLGVMPTKAENAGKRGKVPKCSFWQLASDEIVTDGDDVYPVIDNVIQKIRPAEGWIIAARKQFAIDCVLQVVIRIRSPIRSRLPPIGLDVSAIQFLSNVGASFDVDSW